jgi:hypothetical protein
MCESRALLAVAAQVGGLHVHGASGTAPATTGAPPAPPPTPSVPAGAQFLVPRQAYLHGLVPELLPFFSNLLPPGEDTPWFEYEGLPLKWCVRPGSLAPGR